MHHCIARYDMAGAILAHLMVGVDLHPKVDPVAAHIAPLPQAQFFPPGVTPAHMGMGPTAYVYTPASCTRKGRGGSKNRSTNTTAAALRRTQRDAAERGTVAETEKDKEDGDEDAECKIHVVYHGCNSSVQAPGGLSIVRYAGYNGWAESNKLIIIYPQSLGSTCWDWTGATIPGNANADYDTRDGMQTGTVNRMVDYVAAGMYRR